MCMSKKNFEMIQVEQFLNEETLTQQSIIDKRKIYNLLL